MDEGALGRVDILPFVHDHRAPRERNIAEGGIVQGLAGRKDRGLVIKGRRAFQLAEVARQHGACKLVQRKGLERDRVLDRGLEKRFEGIDSLARDMQPDVDLADHGSDLAPLQTDHRVEDLVEARRRDPARELVGEIVQQQIHEIVGRKEGIGLDQPQRARAHQGMQLDDGLLVREATWIGGGLEVVDPDPGVRIGTRIEPFVGPIGKKRERPVTVRETRRVRDRERKERALRRELAQMEHVHQALAYGIGPPIRDRRSVDTGTKGEDKGRIGANAAVIAKEPVADRAEPVLGVLGKRRGTDPTAEKAAEHGASEMVNGAHFHALQGAGALTDLVGRLVRESDEGDLVGTNLPTAHEVVHPREHGVGLARPGASKDQGAILVNNGGTALVGIELRKGGIAESRVEVTGVG